jgi:ribonuclease HI
VKIYCDGACSGNPGTGGWGIQIHLDSGIIQELGDRECDITTNNRMELLAVIRAMTYAHEHFKALKPLIAAKVEIITDSKYVIHGATEWLLTWRERDFCKADGSNIENQDLWKELNELCPEYFTFKWIKGHNGDSNHERVDQLAADLARNKAVQFFYGRPAPPRAGITYPLYLVFKDQEVKRFTTWHECQSAVSGVKLARYKRVTNPFQEAEQLREWGFGRNE